MSSHPDDSFPGRAPAVWLALAALVLLAASPRPAPRLLRSDPAAEARLGTAPAEIRLWFSEAPELAVSRIRVDRGDQRVETGSLRAGDAEDLSVRLDAASLQPGRYNVTWRTAGADLETVRGSFAFEILATAPSSWTCLDRRPESAPRRCRARPPSR